MKSLNFLCVIPARYASSRFPGKPLIDIRGKSMIQRVYRQCKKANHISKVVVATDDERIFEHVKTFGGEVLMTSEQHKSGTDRVGEVAKKMPAYDFVINVQGDEPLINPTQIDLLCGTLTQADSTIATLVKPIPKAEGQLMHDPNTVKAVLDKNGFALYFSRAAIPFLREDQGADIPFFKHIGMYGFRRETLLQLIELPLAPLEQAESLEQLRWLYHGYKIRAAITHQQALSIDSPEDLERLLAQMEEGTRH